LNGRNGGSTGVGEGAPIPANESLYRLGLSAVSAAIIGVLAAIVGVAWVGATGAAVWPVWAFVIVAAIWGAIVVHLTPTGGTITANRTTVNYAVFALHAWYALFLCLIALLVFGIRSWVL
jgi:hypothetical protein